jgi:DNA polymerase I-like protein with 3'-5' exonuclease and polymerase domains
VTLNGVLVTDVSQLPAPPSGWRGELYIDLETRSGDRERGGVDPHHGDRACGIAMTWDDNPLAWYAPIRHNDERWNVPIESTMRWLTDWMRACSEWANHNIKFDAHVIHYDGVPIPQRLVDTLVLAKLHDTSRIDLGLGYGLKVLGEDWLNEKAVLRDEVADWLAAAKTKDFADAPADLLGAYARNDVLLCRRLRRWLDQQIPPEMARLKETEIQLTSVLYRMERRGLKTVPELELKRQQLTCLRRMILASDELKSLTGVEYVNSNDHAYEILINQLGLPIVSHTRKKDGTPGGPSFDAEAMDKYATLPQAIADERIKRVISLMLQYRTESVFKSLFVESFLDRRCPDGLLRSSYNQIIRTGRMSSSDPNSQQMNKRAKALIIPKAGAFFVIDASQIEFRIIVHYINDAGAIDAYRRDPRTDFHRWVSELTHMARDPAKNVNFACAYGAGRTKVTRMLATNETVIREVLEEIAKLNIPEKERVAALATRTRARAESMYATYHSTLPGIRITARAAEETAQKRGYVFNAYGRRRKLPSNSCHKAFNSLVQGCAMDFIKDRMVALDAPCETAGAPMVINVHDELAFDGPPEVIESPDFQRMVVESAQVQSVPFRVPFLWTSGSSRKNLAEAKR